MKYLITNFIVPIVVGICSLVLLEDGLVKLSNIKLREVVLRTDIKLLILFSAAYAANGTKILPAVAAIYIYYLITSEEYEVNLEKLILKKDEEKEKYINKYNRLFIENSEKKEIIKNTIEYEEVEEENFDKKVIKDTIEVEEVEEENFDKKDIKDTIEYEEVEEENFKKEITKCSLFDN